MSTRLDGKIAVITGGASGIGKASVERFIAEGAHVVMGDLENRTRRGDGPVSRTKAGLPHYGREKRNPI